MLKTAYIGIGAVAMHGNHAFSVSSLHLMQKEGKVWNIFFSTRVILTYVCMHSLVPRPFSPPVFDCSQYRCWHDKVYQSFPPFFSQCKDGRWEDLRMKPKICILGLLLVGRCCLAVSIQSQEITGSTLSRATQEC